MEQQLVRSEDWERIPKPVVTAEQPPDLKAPAELIERFKLMCDMIRLALETDSTRIITLFIRPLGTLSTIPGVSHETHSMTHHGNRPEVLDELRKVEEAQLQVLAELLGGLRASKEESRTLLDNTMVLHRPAPCAAWKRCSRRATD